MPLQENIWELSAHDFQQLPNENPIHALVIGINNYQFYDDLSAAVADADAIQNFLMNRLKVSPSNIINLRDGEATRQGILDAFERLETNTISTADPCIIIYYAGYGASCSRSNGWKAWASDDFIEQMCPSDLGAIVGGEVVEGIPDRVICGLLNSLSEKRGNNITLIMDCCFSAGINRCDEAEKITRYIHEPPPLTMEANHLVDLALPGRFEPAVAAAARMASGFGNKHDQSHLLLTACGRNQVARENNEGNHGIFTKALLKCLSECEKLDGEKYDTLIKNLHMPPWQTARCLGAYSDRPLFNRRGNRSDRSYMPCKRCKSPHGEVTCTLYAGRAQGIELGQQFSIHERIPFEGGNSSQPSIGTMEVVSVESTSSKLEFLAGTRKCVPRVFYARPLSWAWPKQNPSTIYCQDRELLDAIFPPRGSMKYTEEPTQAALILTVEGDQVHIDQNDLALNDYIPTRFACDVKCNETQWLRNIIRSWRHFNYLLHRRPRNSDHDAFPQVRMELHYLEPANGTEDDFCPEYKPAGANLLAQEPAFVPVSDDDSVGDTAKMLGMTLYNDGPTIVYPYLFYFDPNDLTITPWETPAKPAGPGSPLDDDPIAPWEVSARSTGRQSRDARILPGSKLTLGYGDGGGNPWEFVFQDDRSKDVGFFRLFLSSIPANFACLSRRKTSFEEDVGWRLSEEDLDKEAKEVAALEKKLYNSADSWGVKAATVIQVRGS